MLSNKLENLTVKSRLLRVGVLSAGILAAQDNQLQPPKFKLDTVGWTLTGAALGAIALDHDSTRRIISAGGRETNGLISNGHGGISYGKFIALDAANIGSVLFTEGFAKWRIPAKYQWVNNWLIRPGIAIGIAVRFKNGPVHNYSLLNSHHQPR